MLGCEICLDEIFDISPYLARYWLDLVKCSVDEDDIHIITNPSVQDMYFINQLEKFYYIRTTEKDNRNRLYINMIHQDGVACNNPSHEDSEHYGLNGDEVDVIY